MPLTTDEMNIVLVDHLNGSKPRITGPDAEQFLKEVQPDIDKANKEGLVVEVPAEWEVE